MSVEWPTGFERTPPAARTRNRSYQASIADTTADIETEMDRLDPEEWRASIGNQHTKSNGLPLHNASPDDPAFVLRWTKDGEQFAVACDSYSRLRDNLRTVYLWVHETRMRAQRPVETGESEFAAARLPHPDDVDPVVGRQPPHEVLEVSPDASESVVEAAYNERVKEAHPDHGGSLEELKRVRQAKESMLEDDDLRADGGEEVPESPEAWVLEEVRDQTSPEPDGYQDTKSNVYTGITQMRSNAKKPRCPWTKDRVEAAVQTLADQNRLLYWHGLLAPVSDEHLNAVVQNEQEASFTRTGLVGKANRVRQSNREEESEEVTA